MTKDELLEKYRYTNVYWDDWHEPIFEDFIGEMYKLGIPLEQSDILYSGFCSQGDGASFTTLIEGANFITFCRAHDIFKDYPIIEKAYDMGIEPDIKVSRHSNRYSHSNTVSVDLRINCYFADLVDAEPDDIRVAVAGVLDTQLFNAITDAERDATQILRGYMDDLYSKLDEAYYHDISDEVVWESIQANGLDLVCSEKGCENDVKEHGDVCLECKLDALEYQGAV